MSFTVYRYKDGKKIPITMSIWDAFKGVPDPKPRKPKPCACCGKFHAPKPIDKDACKENDKKEGGDGGKPNNYSTSPTVEFTAEDDAKILELKAEEKTWNQIREAIGKGSKSQVIARYKELSQKATTTEEAKKEETKKQAEKKAIGEKKKAANLANKEKEGKAGKGKSKAKAEESKGKDNEMKAWAESFDKQKWIAVASKHFDKTGERLTPQAAKAMAEGKA